MLLRLLICSTVVIVGLQISTAQSRESGTLSKDSATVATSARRFLSAWLVKRNVKEAMGFVAANPVLSRKCDLPPNVKRVPAAPLKRRKIVQTILSNATKKFPSYKSLSSATEATEIPSADWLQVQEVNGFQLLRIRPGDDGYIMCKFEEDAAYRKSMLRADAYYVAFKLKNIEDERLQEWISLWALEHHQWRLLSIGLLED